MTKKIVAIGLILLILIPMQAAAFSIQKSRNDYVNFQVIFNENDYAKAKSGQQWYYGYKVGDWVVSNYFGTWQSATQIANAASKYFGVPIPAGIASSAMLNMIRGVIASNTVDMINQGPSGRFYQIYIDVSSPPLPAKWTWRT